MFEELDDPAPSLRAEQTLPSVRTRGRSLQRRRRLVAAGGGGTAVALVAAVALALPGDETSRGVIATDPVPTSGPSATATPSPAPSAGPTPAATAPSAPVSPSSTAPVSPSSTASVPDPAGLLVELRGDDLAVTAVGAARDEAVAALTSVLGPPTGDPASDVACVSARTEVAWSGFRIGIDASGRLSGWVSTSPDLVTPSGVGVGTTVERLAQVYGDRLELVASDTEAGDTYTVRDVQMLGSLSGTAPSDRVVALRNGDCTGP